MRTTWNGSLNFGLVSVPVGLAPATKPSARQSDVSFRLLHRECMTPIKQQRCCPTHDMKPLAPEEIVKGWEASKGHFVTVEEDEMAALESTDDSRSIEISQFVDLDEVDPIWRDRVYFLVPGKTAAHRRPYRLLVEAMEKSGKGGLGRFVRSGKESICLVRARGDALILETLYLAEDVYSDAEISEAMNDVPAKEQELALAEQIVDGLSAPFEPSELTSSYRSNLRAMLQAKLDGKEIVTPAQVEAPEPASDLLAALQASVVSAKGGAKKPAAPKKPAAKKPRAPKQLA